MTEETKGAQPRKDPPGGGGTSVTRLATFLHYIGWREEGP